MLLWRGGGSCSDIIIVCVADNINMVMQALGRAHRMGHPGAQSGATIYIYIYIYIYNTLMPYTDDNGNKKMWYTDMAVRQTISQVITTSLYDTRHRLGL